ncbi:beta-ketoacyl-[acyl-carrier-protein] synthase family protein [Streptomonospora salina]|uniref:3-oxoacyl-[acyl-carrier-protein] synthase II n=1 Tax=Streptomonospora salina TaxID=104205 RepID=A0A841EAE6_9ACTN|nr:beta-ketoacyl-[acyl-carrier-protein] synthase family protein [Streptomonospora salina]MBB5999976.1 3-oxoacyl-[acyl-carrier-protein] synthase II [Streptomonospora salina]
MTDSPPVTVTGIGLVTPAGVGRASNWTAVCSGAPTAGPRGSLAHAPVGFASTVPDEFDAGRLTGRRRSRRYDRSTQFALVAAQEALDDARLTPTAMPKVRVAVVMGTAFGGVQTLEDNHARLMAEGPDAVNARFLPNALANMVAGILSIELGTTGPAMVVSTACASGATAIGTALGLLRSGAADVAVAGGTDASVTPLQVAGFDKLRALSRGNRFPPAQASRPFDAEHDGFVIGEGAGVLVLERESDATARGISSYATLAGYGTTSDAYHITSPAPDGRGAKEAISRSCHDAGLLPRDIAHVNAHATSTPTGDAVEAGVVAATAPTAVVTSTKGVTGHTMGAAGAIEAAYTALALHTRTVPPVANLGTPCERAEDLDLVIGDARPHTFANAVSSSFGFGGHNAVLAFTVS